VAESASARLSLGQAVDFVYSSPLALALLCYVLSIDPGPTPDA